MNVRKCVVHLFLFMFCTFMLYCQTENNLKLVESPSGQVEAQIFVKDNGQLNYLVRFYNQVVVDTSILGVIIDNQNLGLDVKLGRASLLNVEQSYKTRGHHPVALNYYNQLSIPVLHKSTGQEYEVQLRAYDDGIALRYIIPNQSLIKINGEKTQWKIPQGGKVWLQDSYGEYTDRYENAGFDTASHSKPGIHQRIYQAMYFETEMHSLHQGSLFGPPLLIQLPNNQGYGLLAEGNLVDFSGMMLQVTGPETFQVAFFDSWSHTGDITTPWRLLILSRDLNGIVNSDLVTSVCPEPQAELKQADWIQPGRPTWSWYSSDTGPPERHYRYANMAAELHFEYNLIDWHWEESFGENHWQKLKDVISYSRQKGVNVWVWQHSKFITNRDQRREYFRKVKEAGAVGVKIDFFPPETEKTMDLYEAMLKDAADSRLMVNFHGCNKPTGRSRTWPNEMTREAVRGNEWHTTDWGGTRSLTPEHNTIVPFTRFVQGHGDFTPVIFDPEELRGFSWAHQLAQSICYISSVTFWCDHPKFYLENPALDLIKEIPTVWDETKVLSPSEPGEVAAIARRKGNTWFIGILNNVQAREISIELDFLGENKYTAVLLSDNPQRPDSYIRTKKYVDEGEKWTIRMRSGGGFVARLSPSK